MKLKPKVMYLLTVVIFIQLLSMMNVNAYTTEIGQYFNEKYTYVYKQGKGYTNGLQIDEQKNWTYVLGIYENSNNKIVNFLQCLNEDLTEQWIYEAAENHSLSSLTLGENNTLLVLENDWYTTYRSNPSLVVLNRQNGSIISQIALTTYDFRGLTGYIFQKGNRIYIFGTQYIPTATNNKVGFFAIDLNTATQSWAYNLSVSSMNTYSAISCKYCAEDGYFYCAFNAATNYMSASAPYLLKLEPVQGGTRIYKELTEILSPKFELVGQQLYLVGANVSNTNEMILLRYNLELTLINSQSLLLREKTIFTLAIAIINGGTGVYVVDRLYIDSIVDTYFAISYFKIKNGSTNLELMRTEYYGNGRNGNAYGFSVSTSGVYLVGYADYVTGTNYGCLIKYDRFDTSLVNPLNSQTDDSGNPFSLDNILHAFSDSKNIVPLCIVGVLGIGLGLMIRGKKLK